MDTLQLGDEDLHINTMMHLDPLFLLCLSMEQGELVEQGELGRS